MTESEPTPPVAPDETWSPAANAPAASSAGTLEKALGESPFGPINVAQPAFDRRAAAWGAGLAVALLCLGLNLASFTLIDAVARGNADKSAQLMVALGVGLIAGEIAALSTLLVWVNGVFLLRLLVVWSAAASYFAFWFLGMLVSPIDGFEREIMIDVAIISLAALPLISLSLQLPQWWMRIYLHWRLVGGEVMGEPRPRESLSIRDMLSGTAIVALTLTATRFTADTQEITPAFWLAWLIALGVLMAVGQFILMPLVLVILRWRSILLALAFTLLAPLAVPLIMGIVSAVNGGGAGPSKAYLLTYLAALGCLATASAPLWIARLAGYRLALGNR